MKTLSSRNSFFTAVFLSMLLLFSGCQSSTDPNTGIQEDHPLERRIGILKSLGGIKTSDQGTHLLKLDNGDTILLRSLQLNLDDAIYLNQTVEVRGLLNYTTDERQIMEVMNIDVLDEVPNLKIESKTWEDYESKELAFAIKYRSDFKVKQLGNSVTFEKTYEPKESETDEKAITHSFKIERFKLEADQTALTYLGIEKEDQMSAAGVSKSKIGVKSLDAFKKMFSGINGTGYFVQQEDFLYGITIEAGNDEFSLEDQNLFHEMLGTFQLLDEVSEETMDETLQQGEENTDTEKDKALEATSSDTTSAAGHLDFESNFENVDTPQELITGFETLQSEAFHFSMQYPKQWYYSGAAGTSSDVARHYEFGSKPLEEAPGSVTLDVTSGSIPSGTSLNTHGKEVIKVEKNGLVEIYVKGNGGRVYKISGSDKDASTLLQMAGTLQDT